MAVARFLLLHPDSESVLLPQQHCRSESCLEPETCPLSRFAGKVGAMLHRENERMACISQHHRLTEAISNGYDSRRRIQKRY